ncbi:AAA family ATPase [Vibrio sp. 665]|uniref:ATP-binding protein n=1 Tax=Vibrio TaxID=662 RepID=UPI001BD4FE1C|nr:MULTISPECIES: AAA family ATPase [Vibrio]MBS9879783.1 AAA family ATPase [Vibrio alginolyticus]MDW2023876.1 AAA family ATPase [Vibrio sp. 397]MDW2029051.1 AAA family ATPase [Vibrio sp. 399]MDW2031190.1 AAA family ATPase [Vibrio sp. 665]MDW2215098.1 AAA family ATPase [Vibrio sp. 1982]
MFAVQRLPAEQLYKEQLTALQDADTSSKPAHWQLSPKAVRTFILGSDTPISGQIITRKIYGNDAVVERAIVTLLGQQGLMLVGEPGTAKSLLSELLSAAICGNSTYTVQGSAGLFEENIRYSWNYATLLKSGPTMDAMVPGPLFNAMKQGAIMRFEELTRCPTEVQDNLIPILSDRILHIPEIQSETNYLLSQPGFTIIASTNLNDRGVNQMSSALKRRFNFEVLKPLAQRQQRIELVMTQVNDRLKHEKVDLRLENDAIDVLVTVFDELKSGQVAGVSIPTPSTLLSIPESINLAFHAAMQCHYFGDNHVTPVHLAQFLMGTVIKDNQKDHESLSDYIRVITRQRANDPQWALFLDGCKHAGI